MQKHRVSNSDLFVSAVGLGTVKFGRNTDVKYPNAFSLPSDDELSRLLQTAKQMGINFIDTAPAYGNSEIRIGELIKNERHDWVIMSKAGETFQNEKSDYDFSRAAITRSVENSLQRLQTHYLDILLIHSNGDDEKIIHQDEVFVTLQSLKNAGKIRVFGMSTKTLQGGLLTIDHADAVMIALNPLYQDELPVVRYAAQHHKSVFIKKAFMSGHLSTMTAKNPIEECMQSIWQHPGVTSVITGTLNPKHLIENVQATVSCLTKFA